ncbi:MAG: hypothetical protein ABEJ77_04595 [Halanaeroarchaeum sp.]
MSRPSTSPALEESRPANVLAEALSGYETVVRPIEALAFWAAVVMPFVYLPLFLTGIGTGAEAVAFAALIAVHALALIGGRRYRAGH